MKTIIIVLAVSLGFLWGCETRTFTFVSTIPKTLEYSVDQTGAFSETYNLYADDFNDDLDLPEDAIIRAVEIESFAIKAEPQEGNEASVVRIDCYAGTETEPFAEDVPIPVDLSLSYKAMPGLASSLVSKLRDELEGFVVDSNPLSIAFRIEGDSDPAGERIHALIQIKVTITVGYEKESEFPSFL